MRKYRRKSDYNGCDPNTHTVLLPMTQNEADRLYKWFENTLSAVDADSPFQSFLGKLMKRLNKNFQSAPVRKIPERLVEWERLAHTSGFPEEAQQLMDDMMSALLGLVDPPETDEEKLTVLADQIEAALVPSGTCWPGFDYASARSKVKQILRYEMALVRAGK